ncbi:AEC family transporter [Paenibacillus polymyxa]|uniref:AEC family transporter n=1 Tax=Paenibacillus polymyxa TaxID=1406 RepID=UPI002AB3A60A|nr:AEC family transporter [Paenibacillus polymyxa]MDY8026197.1 AEC family transporter [Paenibacillus polymyxa]
MSVGHILYILVPIFFVIILGWLAGHYKSFDASSSKALNALVTKFALPAHLFIGITKTNRQSLIEQWPFLMALFIGIVGFYVVLLLLSRFALKQSVKDASMFALNSAQPTFAFMGIPVLGAIYGSSAVAIPIALTGIVVNAVLDPAATIIATVASRNSGKERNGHLGGLIWDSILHGLKEPLALVPLVGVVLTLVGFHSPDLLNKSLNQIGDITSGAALFAVGVTIGVRNISFSISAFAIALLKTIVQPLLMLLIAHLCGLSSADTVKAVLLVSFPGSAVAAMIATRFESLESETASSFVISAVISLITLPILISLLV